MRQFIETKEDAISKALTVSGDQRKSVIVIYTHGEGHEIVANDFVLDRQYYHGRFGKKMFFTYVAEVFPGGLVNYNEKADA